MRTLIIIAFSILLIGCGSRQPVAYTDGRSGVLDLTTNGTAACELHRVTLSTQTVDLEFGMKRLNPIDEARSRLFPHANEAYDTGWCMPPYERYARVFVCPRCTEARTLWITTNPIALR
ncbi:MAG TPA: hypothetical protein VNT99_20350 [Methylomirabilota bacterium]|nr:hypothetical protein [Methylomirabilota bacterium]